MIVKCPSSVKLTWADEEMELLGAEPRYAGTVVEGFTVPANETWLFPINKQAAATLVAKYNGRLETPTVNL